MTLQKYDIATLITTSLMLMSLSMLALIALFLFTNQNGDIIISTTSALGWAECGADVAVFIISTVVSIFSLKTSLKLWRECP